MVNTDGISLPAVCLMNCSVGGAYRIHTSCGKRSHGGQGVLCCELEWRVTGSTGDVVWQAACRHRSDASLSPMSREPPGMDWNATSHGNVRRKVSLGHHELTQALGCVPRESHMCGRYSLIAEIGELALRFEFEAYGLMQPPRYNIAPTQMVLAVRSGEPRLVSYMRWGLIPRGQGRTLRSPDDQRMGRNGR